MKINVHDFIEKAKHFMGQRYVWGGGHGGTMKHAGGVDCSGLISQALQQAGIHVSGTAAELQKKGKPVSMKNLQKGDLVFIGKPATHVGIYMGNGKVLHASSGHHKVMMANLKDVGFTNAVRLPQVVPSDANQAQGGHGHKSTMKLG
jgi:cell wall-associated NlpC family hydrolase